MRNIWLILLIFCSVGFVQAQDQPTEEKPQQSRQLNAGEILTVHAARTYQLALRYNDYMGARMALYDILAENPNSDSILYTLSVMFLESGQYASAAISATDLQKLNPDHLGGAEIRAIAFENLGVLDKAVENYEDLYFKTSDYQSLYKVAFLQHQLERFKESNTNVDVLLEKKESDDLKALFQTADNQEKEFPLKAALYNLKGLNAQGLGNMEEAKAMYQKALEVSPDFPLALENLEALKK
jgi:tetratricopeptide (TPR) repeat protein